MSKPVFAILYVLLMVALIVGLDLAFLRDYFWARLAVNVGIVLEFDGFYLRFLNGSS